LRREGEQLHIRHASLQGQTGKLPVVRHCAEIVSGQNAKEKRKDERKAMS
jgi:hypothetical protein